MLKMLKQLKKQGFASIVEVVVTAIIFTLAVFGIMTTVSALRPQATNASDRLQTTYTGQMYFDYLRQFVNGETWQEQ